METMNTAERQQYDTEGFVVLRGLLTAEEVAEIRDTFMGLAVRGPVEGLSDIPAGPRSGTRDPLVDFPRMMNPHSHPDQPVGPLASRLMLDERLHRVVAALLGEEPFAVQSMFYFKPPGARGQGLHQDNFYLQVKPGTCMAAWIAVDDTDEGNGGMMCVPNTSALDVLCPETADSALSFTAEHVRPPAGLEPRTIRLTAGDVLFFNGSVIHGSTPNSSSDRFRRSLIFHYVPASTQEISAWYRAVDFDGRQHDIAVNEDGGPCGSVVERSPH